jgi:O-glycosyl hydrolase
MKVWRFAAAVSVLAALAAGVASAAVEVKIDPAREYQKIDGFGAFGGKVVPWSSEPYFDDEFLRLLIDDLGVTIVRDEVPCNFQLNPDTSDPSLPIDLSKYTPGQRPADGSQGSHRPLTEHLPYYKALKAKAEKSGEPLKIIASVWSPPYWMKYVNSIFGGDHTWNRLKAQPHNDSRDRFAQYCAAYCKYIKAETGLDIYAFSPQNEPYFAQGYQSCVYDFAQLADIVGRVGRRFEKEGIPAKIFTPEDVTELARIKSYISAVLEDPLARKHTGVIAVHGYANDGISRDSTLPTAWAETYALCRKYNKPLWMTETSGYGNSWGDAMKVAQAIYAALKHGKLSAWVWWQINEPGGTDMVLMSDGKPTHKYYVSKNYYRYVRPGAICVEATSSDDQVAALAFKHPEKKTMTVVLINSGAVEKDVTLAAEGLPASFKAYRSSEGEGCVDVGSVEDGALKLPASSIVTLVAADYQGPDYRTQGPAILEQSKDVTAAEGEQAEFSVTPRGSFPYECEIQWQKNGLPLEGQIYPACILKNVKAEDHGAKFTAVLSNPMGKVTSAPATLTVANFSGAPIARAATPPSLDADKPDEAWQNAKAVKIANVARGPIGGEQDLSGTFRMLWDDQALYLLADIVDDVKKTDPQNDFESDGVELYMDGDNFKGGNYDENDFQYLFVIDSKQAVEVKHAPPKGDTPVPQASLQGVAFATAATESGYRIVAKLPWSAMNAKPEAGKFIGVDVHINDNDSGKRDKKIAWFATADNVWESPSRMGTGKLMK